MKNLLCFLFIIPLFLANHVFAEETGEGKLMMEAVNPGAAGYFYIKGKPGEQHKITVKLTNTSDKYKGSATLFISDAITGKGGSMATMTPEMAIRKNTASWFSLKEETIELQPGQVKLKDIVFTIPNNAGPGDHIANIVLYKFVPSNETNNNQNNKANITINSAYSQSYAVWVKMEGEEKHLLDITKISPNWNGSNLFLDIHFVNNGNALEKSSGIVKVYRDNELLMEKEGEMGSIYPNNDAVFSVLANEKAKQPGKYRVIVNWTYDEKSFEKELSYEIKGTDTKRAEKFAKNENVDNNKPEGFYITKGDLIKYDLLIIAAIIALFLLFWFVKKRGKT